MNDTIYIIGGGPEITQEQINYVKDKCTMTINKSFFTLPTCDYFITVDNEFHKRISSENLEFFIASHAHKVFIANFGTGVLRKRGEAIYDIRFKKDYNLKFFDEVIESHTSSGIGFGWNDFRTGNNSGFCALQYCILKGFKKIYLLGVGLMTLDNKTHHHGGYGENADRFSKKLEQYKEEFIVGLNNIKKYKPDIEIYSCSPLGELNEYIPHRRVTDG